jgi:NAD(P)-dependent dehydrogenase (short-subunit alcohol dehydrogenase family)
VVVGVNVTLFDTDLKAVQVHAKEIGGTFQVVDVSDAQSVANGLAAVKSAQGGLDILVNCAGIGPAEKTVSRGLPHDPDVFAKVVGINLIGSFNCASQAAALMLEHSADGPDGERGVILNTASVAAYEGLVGQVAYAASKGGIVAMTLPMARYLAADGVRVCTIAPGLFLTPLLAGLSDDLQASLGQQVPFPSRLGDPAKFAAMACHIMEIGC